MKMRKIFCLTAAVLLLFTGCAGAGYEKTDATEAAKNAYIAAVQKNTDQTAGHYDVKIVCDDTAIQHKKSSERYTYDYTVDESGGESFVYTSFDENGTVTDKYETKDGKVYAADGTESKEFGNYLSHKTNPISRLTLFRMDANFKFHEASISEIRMEEKDGKKVITVVFHPDKLTSLSIKNTSKLKRIITSHTRTYTVEDGFLTAIHIHDEENAVYEGEKGTIVTDTYVEASFK